MARRKKSDCGFALVLVLFVTAILMIVVLEFAHSMQVYAALATNNDSTVRLRAAGHAGVSVAERLLLDDLLADVENEVEADSLEEAWAEELPEIELAGVTASVRITDESGKFPLLSLVEYQFEQTEVVQNRVVPERRRQLRALFEELDLEPDLVDVIVDWMDVDDLEEPFGAEAAAYAGLGRVPRNGRLTSIAELELLLGFTHEMVWGDPEDPDILGLADVCTVHGLPDGQVNANTALEPVLVAVLPAYDTARRVVSERGREPFIDAADLGDRVGDAGVGEALATASNTWSVRVDAWTDHAVRPLHLETTAVLRRARQADEDEAAATPDGGAADEASAVPTAESAQPAERGVITVLAWSEVR